MLSTDRAIRSVERVHLAPEVTGAPEKHAIALELRRRLVFVGVHQTLDMNALTKRFARAIG